MKNPSCCRFRFFIPLIILGVVALLALAVRGLWNGVLTDVLDVKIITYWQALGMLVLARILFGGFPRRGGGGFGLPWARYRMMRHWESLTPEEREKMREKMRQRFGEWPRPCCGGEEAETEKPGEEPKG